MFGIPRRYSHFVFGVIQSGLTSLIAAGIASFPSIASGNFFRNWMVSWLVSWATMLPLVVVAGPAISWLSLVLTRDEPVNEGGRLPRRQAQSVWLRHLARRLSGHA